MVFMALIFVIIPTEIGLYINLLYFCPGDCNHQIVQERIEEDYRKESLYWKQIPEKLIVSKRPAKLIIQFSL